MHRSIRKVIQATQRGFSLLEILIALGLMSVLALGMASMMANQSKEMKASDEKLGLQNAQLMLTNVLSNPAFCRCFVGTNTFNYAAGRPNWNWNTQIGAGVVNSSYNATSCAAIGAPLLTLGTALGNDPKMVPVTMGLLNIVETTTNSGIFLADLVVGFDQAALTRSRKPVTIPMGFSVKTSDPAAAMTLISCSSVASNGFDFQALCAQFGGFYTATTPPTCEPTYQ